MAKPTIINRFGTLIGWNNLTINILGREMEGIEEAEYTDEEEVNVAHGAGRYPIGKTSGNYTAKASVSLHAEEVIALQKQLPKGTRIQQIPDFDVIAQYEYNGQLYKDVVRNCSFKNNGKTIKNNDGKIVTKFDLVCTHIDWNV